MAATVKTLVNRLKKEKIKKPVLDALGEVMREKYFDGHFSNDIFKNERIPIGFGQKSEDPLTLARMVQYLSPKKEWRVLEIGTGSGYSTAVLASMCSEVVTIDYHEKLAREAKERNVNLGIYNVKYYAGNALEIDIDLGEFDAVIVFAGCTRRPFLLLEDLKEDGILVYPQGTALQQQIVRFVNSVEGGLNSFKHMTFHEFCTFESIRGKYGWIDLEPDLSVEPDV